MWHGVANIRLIRIVQIGMDSRRRQFQLEEGLGDRSGRRSGHPLVVTGEDRYGSS